MPSGVPSRGTFQILKAIVASLPKTRYFPLIVAALGVLLASPALRAGLIIDDFYHRAVLRQGSFVWLCFRGTSFEPFLLPAVGEETEIRFDLRAVITPPGLRRNAAGSH